MSRPETNASVFLIELMISILFFALCAAIVMRAFAGAQLMAQESAVLSRSVLEAESAAECYMAARGDLAQTAALYGGRLFGEDTLYVTFDASWTQTAQDASYILLVQRDQNGYAEIRVRAAADSEENQTIYSITVKAVT